MDPQGRGNLKALAAGALWTQVRLKEAGYEVSDSCPLCGGAKDTLFHRWWRCPHTEEIRTRVAPKHVLRWAAAADESSLAFSRAIVVHPDGQVCGPAPDYHEVLGQRCRDGGWDEQEFEDAMPLAARQSDVDLFTDGSASTHPLAERRRASWSVIWLRRPDGLTEPAGPSEPREHEPPAVQESAGEPLEGDRSRPARDEDELHPAVQEAKERGLVATLTGLVPAWWAQSAQPAEQHGALAAANTRGPGQLTVADCKGVIDLLRLDARRQLNGRRRFAGIARRALAAPEAHSMSTCIRKVRAHCDIGAITDPWERHLAIGNSLADEAAKVAQSRHPPSGKLPAQPPWWWRRRADFGPQHGLQKRAEPARRQLPAGRRPGANRQPRELQMTRRTSGQPPRWAAGGARLAGSCRRRRLAERPAHSGRSGRWTLSPPARALATTST